MFRLAVSGIQLDTVASDGNLNAGTRFPYGQLAASGIHDGIHDRISPLSKNGEPPRAEHVAGAVIGQQGAPGTVRQEAGWLWINSLMPWQLVKLRMLF